MARVTSIRFTQDDADILELLTRRSGRNNTDELRSALELSYAIRQAVSHRLVSGPSEAAERVGRAIWEALPSDELEPLAAQLGLNVDSFGPEQRLSLRLGHLHPPYERVAKWLIDANSMSPPLDDAGSAQARPASP